MKTLSAIAPALLLAACAGYSGSELIDGVSGVDELIRVMGEPRMQWTESDGTRRLAYPRGPMGVHTYMALIGSDGTLRRIENVMDPQAFRRIEAGMNQDQVLRVGTHGAVVDCLFQGTRRTGLGVAVLRRME